MAEAVDPKGKQGSWGWHIFDRGSSARPIVWKHAPAFLRSLAMFPGNIQQPTWMAVPLCAGLPVANGGRGFLPRHRPVPSFTGKVGEVRTGLGRGPPMTECVKADKGVYNKRDFMQVRFHPPPTNCRVFRNEGQTQEKKFDEEGLRSSPGHVGRVPVGLSPPRSWRRGETFARLSHRRSSVSMQCRNSGSSQRLH